MAMSQTDKDIHEMTRRINDISNSFKTLNTLMAKLVGEIGEVSQKLQAFYLNQHWVEYNDDAKMITIVEPCHDTNNIEY